MAAHNLRWCFLKYMVYLSLGLAGFMVGCSQNDRQNHPHSEWVGNINFDPKTDDPAFKLCAPNDVKQYFNFGKGLQYKGEKMAIETVFSQEYQPVIDTTQNGWIRIRFVVNCNGQTGRFRLMASDDDYQPKSFASPITDQLMSITKRLDGWQPLSTEDQPKDYYQYLLFKIHNGTILEILP